MTGEECASWLVGGAPPAAVLFPSDTTQVADVLGRASAAGLRVAAAGRGGNPYAALRRAPVDLVVSTRDLAGVTHYEPADLTLSAGAGTGVSDVQRAAHAHGQFLALDPAGSASGTIGAVVAAAAPGPLCAGYGGTRDIVLGAVLVTGDGRVLRLGGRVVKNVAGFDLLKLAVGSGGRLGVITELSVRLHPVPPRDVTWLFRGEAESLVPLARALATAPVVPSALELCTVASLPDSDSGGTGPWALILRVGGTVAGAQAALDRFAERCGTEAPRVRMEHDESRAFHDAMATSDHPPVLAFRAQLPPSRLNELIAETGALVGRTGGGSRVRIQVTEGVAAVEIDQAGFAALGGVGATLLDTMRERLAERGGALSLTGAPADLLAALPVHAPSPGRDALLDRIVHTFDPHGTLSGAKGLA